MTAWSEYLVGEIDNAAGRHNLAEQRYARAIKLSRTAGATPSLVSRPWDL